MDLTLTIQRVILFLILHQPHACGYNLLNIVEHAQLGSTHHFIEYFPVKAGGYSSL